MKVNKKDVKRLQREHERKFKNKNKRRSTKARKSIGSRLTAENQNEINLEEEMGLQRCRTSFRRSYPIDLFHIQILYFSRFL